MPLRPSAIATDIVPSAAPAAESTASLVLIHPPMPELGLRQPLLSDVVVVGRDESADFTVVRTAISRRHAELRRHSSGTWAVADMGSTNGTFLNEEEVDDAPLCNGDHIQFGDAIFKFVSGQEAHEFHDRIYRLTDLDGLTALHNQRFFTESLYEQMDKAKRVESDMALMVLDIDDLSSINEERGRAGGDLAIKTVAKTISKWLDDNTTASRVKGGEFAVFLRGVELGAALQRAEELRELVAQRLLALAGIPIPLRVSIGVAASAQGELDASEIVLEAQKQLSSAKERGRNCICP